MNIPVGQRLYTQGTGTTGQKVPIFSSNDPTSSDIGPPWEVQQSWINTTTQGIWILETFSISSGIVNAQWRAVAPIVLSTTAPTTSDYEYPLAQIWVDTTTSLLYILVTVSGTTATWENFAGSGLGVDSFTVPAGTSPVVPDSSGAIDLPAGNGFAFTGGTNEMTGAMTSPFTGSFTFNQTSAGTAEVLAVAHSDDTGATDSSARVNVAVGGTTQIGDPYIEFATGSARAYAFGSDTSDSQTLKLTTDTAANVTPSSGTEILTLTSAGAIGAINVISITQASSGQWLGFNDGTDTFGYYNHAGSPEGNVTASIGSWCSDTTNGELYVKNSGDASNTGWALLDSSASPDFTWTEITDAGPTAMSAENGYIANNAVSTVELTMPSTAAVGTLVRVVGKGAGGFQIQQNADQTIHFSSTDTTTGIGGSVSSTITYNAIEMVCITADLDFVVLSSIGNFTLV